MSEETGTTANLSTETPTEPIAEAPVENTEVPAEGRPSIDNYKDEYDQRVDALLAEYEAQKNGTPPPEKEGLREGESWDKLFDQADENSQRAMQQLRADYTRKTQELAAQRKEIEQQRQELEILQANLQGS